MLPLAKRVLSRSWQRRRSPCLAHACLQTNLLNIILLLGSLGPPTVTFIALLSVATCGGDVLTIIDRVKLFPETNHTNKLIYAHKWDISTFNQNQDCNHKIIPHNK